MSERTKCVPVNWPECEEFYNLMQAYRTAPFVDQTWVSVAYQKVQDFLRHEVNSMLAAAPQAEGDLAAAQAQIAMDSETIRRMQEAGFAAEASVAELESQIDALMLEYCPNEMSSEQVQKFADAQRPVQTMRLGEQDGTKFSGLVVDGPSYRIAAPKSTTCEEIVNAIPAHKFTDMAVERGEAATLTDEPKEMAYVRQLIKARCEHEVPRASIRAMVAYIDAFRARLSKYEENIEYLLKTTYEAVRVREGGGPESLIDSLCVNYIALRDESGRAKLAEKEQK